MTALWITPIIAMSRLQLRGAKLKNNKASVSLMPTSFKKLSCTRSSVCRTLEQAWYMPGVRYSMNDKMCAL